MSIYNFLLVDQSSCTFFVQHE